MAIRYDLTGEKFGRLTVIKRADNKGPLTAWECRCQCGNVVVVRSQDLRRGRQKSCGCKQHDNLLERNSKHLASGTRPYRIWKGMKSRCYNPNTPTYKDYGARGIQVCERWRDSFENFWADMRDSYADNLSIDRIDNDRDYCPENCRWADRTTQNRNSRQNVVTHTRYGTLVLSELAEKTGLNYGTLKGRKQRGWADQDLPAPSGFFGRRYHDRTTD